MTGTGTDFNSYSWTLSRKTASGNLVNPYTTPTVNGTSPVLQDAINVYINAMGNTLQCGEQLDIQLNLKNECEEKSDKTAANIPCLTWKSAYPNIFSPNHPNPINQTFSLTFSAMDYTPTNNPVCSVMGNDITTINYFRVQIFDKWGNKVFDEDIYDTVNSDLKGSEIKWDGTFNGEQLATDVFAFQFEGICAATGELYYHKGNITLVR